MTAVGKSACFVLSLCMLTVAAIPATVQPAAALPGDADGNGTVNAADRAMVAALVDGSLSAGQVPAPYNADVNGDGTVNVLDVLHIALFLNKPDALPPTVSTREAGSLTPFGATAGGEVLTDGGLPVFARGVCWSTGTSPSLLCHRTRDGAGTGAFTSILAFQSDSLAEHLRAYASTMQGTAYGDELTCTPPASPLLATITEPTGPVVKGQVPVRVSVDPPNATVQRVELYVDDAKIAELYPFAFPYVKNWDTTAVTDGGHTLKAIAYNRDGQAYQAEKPLTVQQTAPRIGLSRTTLTFGAVVTAARLRGGKDASPPTNVTLPQMFQVGNEGGGTLNWSITETPSWLTCHPTSGTGKASVSVSVDPSGLMAGTYTGTINVSDPTAANSPILIPITFCVYRPADPAAPFGQFEAPLDGSRVCSSIAVTGWALDDVGINKVSLYRNPVAGESGSNPIYIGDAVFVEDARPDIEAIYPYYPLNYRAGWGYTMLTNFLPDGGNGTYTLTAIATDEEGNSTSLGSKTIQCDNAHAVKPFGAIDQPVQGSTVYGMATNLGWVLTPQPNSVPLDGSTVAVYIDGLKMPGHAYYNLARSDIATFFPGYANSVRSGGAFDYNTSFYPNGLHTINWVVADNAGNADGIGSRYFSINNSYDKSMDSAPPEMGAWPGKMAGAVSARPATLPLLVRRGWNNNDSLEMIPGPEGEVSLSIPPDGRLEIHLWPERDTSLPWARGDTENGKGPTGGTPAVTSVCGGWMVGDEFRPLPANASLDRTRGIFTWQPGPAFRGCYRFVFFTETDSGQGFRTQATVQVGE